MVSLSIGPVSVDVLEISKVVGRTIYLAATKVKEFYDRVKTQDFLIAIIDDFSGIRCDDPFICAWCKVRTSHQALEQKLNEINTSSIYNIDHLNLDPKTLVEIHNDLNGYELDTPELSEFDYIIK